MTLLLNGRSNSLNLVRLMLAGLVIYSHAWFIADLGPEPMIGSYSLGTWAVSGFFCLSGFLIAHSRTRATFGRFMWQRTLRIVPGLWVCLVVTAVIFAPLSLLAGGSLSVVDAAEYVRFNMFIGQTQWHIPGTVDGAPWNGSLWTLMYEFIAYIEVGLLFTLIAARHRATQTVAVGCIVAALTAYVYTTDAIPLASLSLCFFAGVLIYLLADRVPVRGSLAVASVALIALSVASGHHAALAPLPVAYLVLWAGAAIPPRWAQRHDISYGAYIYAFPAQTLIAWWLPSLGIVANVVLTTAIAVALAWASWLLVERPALRLKRFTIVRESKYQMVE